MKLLLLNQTFHPDEAATALHAADVARELARERVFGLGDIAGCPRGDTLQCPPDCQNWEGIRVHRVGALDFGKQSRWRRALNFASFLGAAAWRLARFDVTIAMTTPPLLSVLGAWFVRLRGGRLVLWLMDLNPDEAIAGQRPAGVPLTIKAEPRAGTWRGSLPESHPPA